MPENPKLTKLKELMKLVDESLSRADFELAFSKLMDFIAKVEKNLLQKIDTKLAQAVASLQALQQEFNQVIQNAKDESDSTLSGFKRKTIETINSLFIKGRIEERITEKLNEVDDKLAQLKDGEQGEQGEIGPVGPPGVPGSPDTTQDIVNKLKDKGEDGLHIDDIYKLQEALDELRNRPIGGKGGGFSKIAFDSHIVDNETPTGTPNGILTTFTLANKPNPETSLKVYLDGQRMKLTTDYTFSGVTITFLTAPLTNSLIICDYKT